MPNLKIRFARAVQINNLQDANGNVAAPIVRMKEKQTLHGVAMVVDVKLDTLVTINVPDTSEPPMPIRSANMSDRWYALLCDQSFEAGLERLRDADLLRAKIRHHVKRGNIVVMEDETGFLAAADALDPIAAAIADQKTADAEATFAKKANSK